MSSEAILEDSDENDENEDQEKKIIKEKRLNEGPKRPEELTEI